MMGVTGKDDGLARFFCLRDFFRDARDDGDRFFGTERTGNEILLHIHNDQNVHGDASCHAVLEKHSTFRKKNNRFFNGAFRGKGLDKRLRHAYTVKNIKNFI